MAATPRSGPERTPRVTVPKLNLDPVQSLAAYSVVVTVAGHEMEIPPLPAADWLAVLMSDSMDDIFPGLLGEQDTELFEDLILDGKLGLEEYEQTLFDVIETASARKWWVALRLVSQAKMSWDLLGGELALKRVDPTQVSLSSWLDALLLIILEHIEPRDVQMWTMKLEAPPQDVAVEEDDMAMSSAQFMAMAG